MTNMTTTQTIHQRLLSFQKQCPAIPKDGFNPHFKSSYMKLDTILDTIKPILSELGLVLSQKTKFYPEQNLGTIVTTITNSSDGQSIESEIPYDISEPAQKQGGNITYMRRYALAALLGIAADEDIDGNDTNQQQKAPQKPTQAPIRKGGASSFLANSKQLIDNPYNQ